MNKKLLSLGALATVLSSTGLAVQTAVAQDDADGFIEEIVTTGTRSAKPRSAGDSPVPVDVINADDFTAFGNTADLTDNIKALVPSYTATPATGDGSAFVRPTSLRGTAPDQVLVLVNGKRRHRTALVQFFAPAAGNGAHGVDIGMIPGLAVKRVEVLRDGASSQYGSDAIAGVINFILKDADEGGQVQAQYGQFFDDEDSLHLGVNAGFAIGNSGFVNATIEYVDNDALSRGVQRPDAQTLIDMGVPEVGTDAPFGDSPLVQTWGRPETKGTRVFVNSGFELSGSSELYARFSLGDTEGRYRFFYRHPITNSVFSSQVPFGAGCPTCDPNAGTPLDDPSIPNELNLREQGFVGLPGGFTPFLDGDQDDASITLGVEGEFDSGMTYDFSYTYGKSELDYTLNNTANQSLGPGDLQALPQMDFNVGGYAQEENTVNADFSIAMADNINLAFGVEVREETFTASPGEPSSFFGAGSSGFRGIEPGKTGDFDRDNVAIYADVEHDITDQFLVQYAARYENFSDFGNTLNGKVAARYRVNDAFAIRGAVSTGFHAPTPGQTNVSTVITTFDGVTGEQVEEGLFPVSDPIAIDAGAQPLTEEKSLNISAGYTAEFGDWVSVTTDIYRIEVDDRIYRTGDIPLGSDPSRTVSYYTNALDVTHEGVELVATSSFDLGAASTVDLSLAYAYSSIDVDSQDLIRGIQPVSDGLVEDIENNYPEHRWNLTGNFLIGEQLNIMTRVTYFGEHYDERGRIGDAVDPSAEIDGLFYVDLEAGWQFNENWRAVLGGSNIFDEFVDDIGPPNANRLSVGLQYPRRTVANYEGGSWYLKGIYSW